MKNFNRAGRELSCRQGYVYPLMKNKYVLECLSLLRFAREDMLRVVILFYMLFVSLSVFPALGQEAVKVRALEIGDTIPEALWNMTFLSNNTEEKSKIFRLKDYEGKLILLDFWATWCASCINGFPKMEELQKAYGDEVKIVLVNAKQSKDSYSRVRQVLDRYKSLYGYEIGLDYLLGDSILQQYFPHQILPHLIWIDKEGILRAASYGKSATMLNVDRALQGDYSQIHQKQDYLYDKEHFRISDLHVDHVLSRRVLTAYIEGLGIQSKTIVKLDGHNYYQIWNKPLRSLYFTAFEDEFRDINADRYQFDAAIDSAWIKSFVAPANVNNKYCYETLLPDEGTEKDGRFQLSQDLLSYFGYKPIRKNIYTEVLLFSQSEKLNTYTSQGGIPRVQLDQNEGEMYLRNSSLQALYFFIAARLNLPFESVLDAGRRVDLTLPDNFLDYSPNQIIQYLEFIGVVVERESKKIDIVQFIKI